MGVPKFFRWISERYPKINQTMKCSPNPSTRETYFPNDPKNLELTRTSYPPIIKPQFDRLYIDMNGIIHCCSHNNNYKAFIESDTDDVVSDDLPISYSTMTDEEIFTNIRYYLDRVISDIVEPLELVYLAVDGVAPRAKLNQQRTRRFRAAKEIEIANMAHSMKKDTGEEFLSGKVHVGDGKLYEEDDETFHSNCITPGSVFLDKCSKNIKEFLIEKLKSDPKYQHLKIIYSGPNVPGEGEHKIMDFIRHEKVQESYNPNIRHCLVGQDGDLIMLGLATHEPHFTLLRERVDFNVNSNFFLGDDDGNEKYQAPSTQESTSKYVDNHDFEFLHFSILRDYLSYEFETKNVITTSPFLLERTIDDFVFMTFLVGNDFLPPLPALSIADGAFDILFNNYKRHRMKWVRSQRRLEPYLTCYGDVTCGRRLQYFIEDISRQNEEEIISRKKLNQSQVNDSIRRDDAKYNRVIPTIPTDEELEEQEKEKNDSYMRMIEDMQLQDSTFKPVVSNPAFARHIGKTFEPEKEVDVGFVSKMMNMIQRSISPPTKEATPMIYTDFLNDIKGRYYHDKFKFSPLDYEKHLELRTSYIKTLVWCLSYYYKGCISWSWYYPYHYAPMLSDLQDLDDILSKLTFQLDEPLKPFDQLLGCIPPSSAFILPKPYRKLMTSPNSPIIQYYPKDFDVDMNGARNPWEAVVLLPFIDIDALKKASKTITTLNEEERIRNEHGVPHILFHKDGIQDVPYTLPTKQSVFEPILKKGVKLNPPGFPTLQSAPIQTMYRKFINLNVFGTKSRYRTAVLVLNEDIIPPSPPAISLGPKFIGTSIYYNYPFLQEGFVTAVADENGYVRGKKAFRDWKNDHEKVRFDWLYKKVIRELLNGNGTTGSGGWMIPSEKTSCILYVRPLSHLETIHNQTVKVYAKLEIPIPLPAALWYPTIKDERYNVPAKLEKNPYQFVNHDIDWIRMEKLMTLRSPNEISSARSFGLQRQIRNYSEYRSKPQYMNGSTNSFMNNQRRRYSNTRHVRTNVGGGKKGIIGLSLILAGSILSSTNAMQYTPNTFNPLNKINFEEKDMDTSNVPPLEHAHGTTTISFKIKNAIITAVDSRATLGNFVGSRTTQKVLPITKYIIGTMAGGAADCSFWIRKLRSLAKLYELEHGMCISVGRVSRMLANYLYNCKNLELSVGTMIVGYDTEENGYIYYVDNSGALLSGDIFAIGSGSTFAVSVVDAHKTKSLKEMSVQEGVVLALKAIRSATLRDAYSGGYINIYVVTKEDGWRKVFSEDLALIGEDEMNVFEEEV